MKAELTMSLRSAQRPSPAPHGKGHAQQPGGSTRTSPVVCGPGSASAISTSSVGSCRKRDTHCIALRPPTCSATCCHDSPYFSMPALQGGRHAGRDWCPGNRRAVPAAPPQDAACSSGGTSRGPAGGSHPRAAPRGPAHPPAAAASPGPSTPSRRAPRLPPPGERNPERSCQAGTCPLQEVGRRGGGVGGEAAWFSQIAALQLCAPCHTPTLSPTTWLHHGRCAQAPAHP